MLSHIGVGDILRTASQSAMVARRRCYSSVEIRVVADVPIRGIDFRLAPLADITYAKASVHK